ncbi:hypothetical protein QMK17_22690 [Rhodococcus sp. G-MC3]|uniref:hypothetical protein n=1 Tax=Rhodococcus sp. G-MC3 TaxID=3046209 RepID=UPI0024BB9E4A|nr:hypothetical protein [Rhodococcus sp. G-MC3]MDJ0396132.1 hypothetical protein [Rhodococcus sp. G-MC3]
MHESEPVDVTEARARGFRRYVEPEIEVLLRVASTLTGLSEAEDLVQETLVADIADLTSTRPTFVAATRKGTS